jgi:hypothetical protein
MLIRCVTRPNPYGKRRLLDDSGVQFSEDDMVAASPGRLYRPVGVLIRSTGSSVEMLLRLVGDRELDDPYTLRYVEASCFNFLDKSVPSCWTLLRSNALVVELGDSRFHSTESVLSLREGDDRLDALLEATSV